MVSGPWNVRLITSSGRRQTRYWARRLPHATAVTSLFALTIWIRWVAQPLLPGTPSRRLYPRRIWRTVHPGRNLLHYDLRTERAGISGATRRDRSGAPSG